jgi:hypothetical protein
MATLPHPCPWFSLSGGNGVKTVYFKVKDAANTESAVTSDTITLGGTGLPLWRGGTR